MTKITADTTLGEVVTANPELTRDLERLGLDYCCGGFRSIGEACEAVGLDPTEVVAELNLAAAGGAQPEEWASMSPAELADHIEATHHRFLWEELPRLSELVEKITTVHGSRHPELAEVRSTYAELRGELEQHLLKEERVLFPLIRELDGASELPAFHCGRLANPISVMLAEHDRAGELLARLRELTGGYQPPADACNSFLACYAGLEGLEGDVHLHIHKENNVLFPLVTLAEAALAGSE